MVDRFVELAFFVLEVELRRWVVVFISSMSFFPDLSQRAINVPKNLPET